jgi:glucose/arabinose dehydrogenase
MRSSIWRLTLMGLAAWLVACTAGEATPPALQPPQATLVSAVPTSRAPQPTVAASPTAQPVASPTGTVQPATTLAGDVKLDVQVFVRNLDTPWAIDFAPDGRIFITERPGRIRIVKGSQLQAEPWMTLDVAETGEAGLLGLALDPQFEQNRYVYVAYSLRTNGNRFVNRLVRLRDDPASGKGVMDKVLLDNVAAAANHDGGRVKFGPDGKLYWTMGDAQNTSSAQDINSLNGKILRLNPDGTIPADNPGKSAVYSYGHRNPQGLAWQSGTGRLYATEHGPSGSPACCRDEVNLIEPGKNYGWPVIMGDQKRDGMISPVIHSGNDTTWAPSGATFVTSGPWAGSLVFAGLRGQSLYRLTLDPNDPRKVQGFQALLERRYGRLRDVVQGPDGALYILTSNGDGRGNLPPEGDLVLRITFVQ